MMYARLKFKYRRTTMFNNKHEDAKTSPIGR